MLKTAEDTTGLAVTTPWTWPRAVTARPSPSRGVSLGLLSAAAPPHTDGSGPRRGARTLGDQSQVGPKGRQGAPAGRAAGAAPRTHARSTRRAGRGHSQAVGTDGRETSKTPVCEQNRR